MHHSGESVNLQRVFVEEWEIGQPIQNQKSTALHEMAIRMAGQAVSVWEEGSLLEVSLPLPVC